MKKGLLSLVVIASLVILGIYVLNTQGQPQVSNTPTQTVALSPTAMASPAASANIEVMSPKANEKVKSPIQVNGNARVFENVVSLRLLDENGNILAETTAQANSPDVGEYGPFQTSLEYSISTPQKGTLEVYQASPKDGSPTDVVSIPLELQAK